MTPLTQALRAPRLSLLTALLMLTAGLTGCLGLGDTGSEDEEAYRLFVAAVGPDGLASTGKLKSASILLNDSGDTRQLNVEQTILDLGSLATSGQAVLAATGPDLNGTANTTLLEFDWLTVGDTNLTGARLQVPVEHPLGPQVETTITLELNLTRERGHPTLENLVVERGETRLKAVTRAELEGPRGMDVPDLPQPTIVASAPNASRPSFAVNEDINFTYSIPDSEAGVRNVFWAFGDGTTTRGAAVQHAYRQPGFFKVTVILEGTRGQQATANTTVDAYFQMEGEGNVVAGTGGSGAVEDRDTKNHTIEIPGNFTAVSVRVEDSPSGGFCSEDTTVENETTGVNETAPTGGHCGPSNVHIELYNAQGELLGQDTSDEDVKWVNVTGLMLGGDWTLRVKGDEGGAIGYSFALEAHYMGLCSDFGGLDGFPCPDPPEPQQPEGGPGLP